MAYRYISLSVIKIGSNLGIVHVFSGIPLASCVNITYRLTLDCLYAQFHGFIANLQRILVPGPGTASAEHSAA